jgi:hypothetical protein
MFARTASFRIRARIKKDQDVETPKKDTGASSLDPNPPAAAAGDLPPRQFGGGIRKHVLIRD